MCNFCQIFIAKIIHKQEKIIFKNFHIMNISFLNLHILVTTRNYANPQCIYISYNNPCVWVIFKEEMSEFHYNMIKLYFIQL